jgi:hypothetical protein
MLLDVRSLTLAGPSLVFTVHLLSTLAARLEIAPRHYKQIYAFMSGDRQPESEPRTPDPGPDLWSECQSGDGTSTLSIESTSTGALVDSSFRPNCSCTAVKMDGAFGSEGSAGFPSGGS